jgi:carbonic anhydrase/acetyltransferase-like protein (isoleucine patch superfamily)
VSGRDRDWPARLELHPTAFVAPGAVVVGEVRLGARASVWFNTVLRGDTDRIEVGEDTNIQDNSTVHVDHGQPAILGARVTVGHRAIIHGCVVGDECLIGMGAIVLSGARIGAGSLVGAGALVREGQEVPPGSLVLGAPARVAGPVKPEHRDAIVGGNAHYVELSRSYLARGFGRPHPPAEDVPGITARAAGPMTFVEWGQLLAALGTTADWAAGQLDALGPAPWREAPGPGRWSALEVLAHLLACDREVFGPRLERLLAEERPELPFVDMEGRAAARDDRARTIGEVLSAFRVERSRLLGRLASLGRAEWRRSGVHSRRGPYALADMVRDWAEHDLSHLRQMAAALGGGR